MRTSLRRTLTRSATRAAVAVTAVALAGSGALVAPADASSAASDASTDWLVGQLADGLMVSEYNLHDGSGWQQYTDYGLTLDAYFALQQLRVKPGKRQAILDAIEPHSSEYTDAFGTRYAGALGKLLTAVLFEGGDPSTYGDDTNRDLLSDLEDLVVTSGPEQGRAQDDPSTSDTSNTFGQSYVATALTHARSPLADDATRFLLKQQCANGYFREGMDSGDFTCDGGTRQESKASVDATATVAIALGDLGEELDGRLQRRVRRASDNAVAWLVSTQKNNGSFVGNGTANTNSTGLAAFALRLGGKRAKATRAAEWVDGLRVTRRVVRTSAYRARDVGAIAYDRAAFDAGKAAGIARADRYQWRRSTAQAAPALDLIG